MHKKFLFILAAVAIFFSSSANAAKIDAYRDAILNKSDKGLEEKMSGNLGKVQIHRGIVIVDGNDMYTETAFDSMALKHKVDGKTITTKNPIGGVCKLVKDNEFFNFYYEIKNDKQSYYGGQSYFGKSHSVKANDNRFQTPYQSLINDYTFGSVVLNDIFSPIIPPERLIATPSSPIYQFVSSGTAKDGLFYEDFASNKENIFNAIRYYFNGDNLVKVAHVSYLKNGNQLQTYEKFVVDINEFSTIPDRKYLSLPAELKVKKK